MQKSGTGDKNLSRKGTFRSGPSEIGGPVKEDHLQRCSKIFRSDLTKMVRSAWFLTGFPGFWAEWKARSCKILFHMEHTLKRCSHSRQPLSVVDVGEGPGGAWRPPYFWTKLRPERAEKKFFLRPALPLSQGLDERPPRPLIWRSGSATTWYCKLPYKTYKVLSWLLLVNQLNIWEFVFCASVCIMTFDIANPKCSWWTVELLFLPIAANRHFLLWFCGLQL